MELQEALDIVVGRTRHEHYRNLCDPSHPRYNPDYIPVVMRMAEEPWPPPATATEYPGLATLAGNALAAAGRAVAAAATAGPILVPAEVVEGRAQICAGCSWFDPGPRRCRHQGCGCFMTIKWELATERCPLDPPKWDRWERP